MRLVSYLVTTSLVFLSLMTLVWIVSLTFHSMHAIYPFSDETFRVLDRLEILLVYLDIGVSGIVLLNGIRLYIVEETRGNS